MRKLFKYLTGLLPALLLMTPPVWSQSKTEAIFVLQDIRGWFPGIYDTEPQIFLENAFGAGEGGPHERMYLKVSSTEQTSLGQAVFLTEWHDGAKAAPVKRRELWAFSVDENLRGVTMKRFPVSPRGDFSVGSVADILVNSEIGEALPCPVLWFRGQSAVHAEPIDLACDGSLHELTLGEEGLWLLNKATIAAGSLVSGRTDRIHTKFFRAREMECFINIVHEGKPTSVGMDGRTLINPVYLHDRGDSFSFQTNESAPRKYVLMLRKAMWPSRSGRNFVPMLMLWLYRDQISVDTIEGSAWASADSGRVAFDARGVGARCKIPTRAN